MQKVQLTPEMLDKIGTPPSEVQVVDDAGQVKGYLISPEYRALVYSWVNSLFDFNEDELRRARAETGGYTTAEAIAYLRELEAKRRSGA
jgi:hypothetical protein